MEKTNKELAAEILIAHIQARASNAHTIALKTDEVCLSLEAIYKALRSLEVNDQG